MVFAYLIVLQLTIKTPSIIHLYALLVILFVYYVLHSLIAQIVFMVIIYIIINVSLIVQPKHINLNNLDLA